MKFSKFNEALDYCERGLNFLPDDTSLNFDKAFLLYITGKKEKSKRVISDFGLNCCYLLFKLANHYDSIKEFDKALEFCKKSIDCDSEYIYSWALMGEIYFNLKEYDESLKYCKKSLDLNQDNDKDIINYYDDDCREFVISNLLSNDD